MAANLSKPFVFGSFGAAGLVAVLALMDMVMQVPFAGASLVMDILFLLSALLVGYLGWDAYKDLT